MFTQRNNKAKCFQDCIVEKKKPNRKMNGLRLKVRHWVGGELGWSCLGVGMGELLGGGDRLGGGGDWSGKPQIL